MYAYRHSAGIVSRYCSSHQYRCAAGYATGALRLASRPWGVIDIRGMSVIVAMSFVILLCLACSPVTATESGVVNGLAGSDNITSQTLPVNDMPSEILIIHLDQPTFAVSLTPTQPITLDLVNHRIMMQLVDGSGNVIGAQSVTVSTT